MQLFVRFLSDSVETVVSSNKCETKNGKPLKDPKEGDEIMAPWEDLLFEATIIGIVGNLVFFLLFSLFFI